MAAIRELISWIEATDNICVIPHVSPDGDCLGSAMAMAVILERIGKKAVVAMKEPVPEMYAFLPGQEVIYAPENVPFTPEGLMFIDVAAINRAGDRGALSGICDNWALIDHHETNAGFAPVSLIDPDAPATGVIISRVMDILDIPADKLLATLLYVAISTDTGNFSFANTTEESLLITAKLMKTGFELYDVNRRAFRLRTRARARLLGKALDNMAFFLDGKLAVTTLTQEMFDICGAKYEHTEGIVNVLADIEGVEVAMTIESRDGGKSTKSSLRSNTDFDVAKIANGFKGGGHAAAAGMNLPLSVDTAAPKMIQAVISAMEG
ncbi:MAG: bifunctional oligoribonuclease/PAP phosphatase NrnA [Clostridia bacterium]|nr:bifunctional oligoribonuclease/PAP phosphatase NrnA [Clostridia bacterium]